MFVCKAKLSKKNPIHLTIEKHLDLVTASPMGLIPILLKLKVTLC